MATSDVTISTNTTAEVPPGRYAQMTVTDDGCGMDEATLEKIFEPFFTTKDLGMGTGLGLATSFAVMSRVGGHIRVSSKPGSGSSFRVYLQASNDAVANPESAVADAVATVDPLTVLLVEDEPAVRAVIVRSLERGGFRVLQAPDAAVALQLADREARLDLVLTDLMMPGMGGAELARRLKGRWPDLPVMFMSGYSAEELRRRGSAHDAVLIQKPFKPDTLLMSVNLALAARTSQ